MTGRDYEFFVARYLEEKGFYDVKMTQETGDFGVDVTAVKGGYKYAVQCKFYSGTVGVKAVQEVIAGKAMYNCDGAMVITNSTFTNPAITLAQKNQVILMGNIIPYTGNVVPHERFIFKSNFEEYTYKDFRSVSPTPELDLYTSLKKKLFRSNFFKFGKKGINEVNKKIDKKLKHGIKAHSKNIAYIDGTKLEIKMYCLDETNETMRLVSEPFELMGEANHFIDCFNDNFLYDATCHEINGKYIVDSGWVRKLGMVSYYHEDERCFLFANWS